MIWFDLEKMAFKSALAVILLLCITAAIEARYSKIRLGSGSLRSNGWFGRKRDVCYSVPSRVEHVTMDSNDMSSSSVSVGGGNGAASIRWTKGNRKACVHAWVNGKVWGSNHISWKVVGWVWHSG